MPYGGRPGEEIVALTRAGCERLFDEGCSLVILACNTAASIALRRLQQTWLPGYRQGARPSGQCARPDRADDRGGDRPALDARVRAPHDGEKAEKLDVLGVFSTPATAASRVYEIEIDKRKPDVAVFSEGCPELARMIEGGASTAELAAVVEAHVKALSSRIGRPPDRAVLGCTHYEIIADLFRAALPPGTPLIHQPGATADAIERYLERHPEYDPGHGGVRRFLTTGRPGQQNGLVEAFWGGPLHFEAA